VLFTAAQTLYLFAPLLFAGALAGLIQRYDWLKTLRKPIDGRATLGGKRLLGDSKTWRGVVIAIAGCSIAASIQKHVLSSYAAPLALMSYDDLEPLAFGAAMGGGAMLGELPNSFVKRRLGIAPGATARGWKATLFYVWDQIDLLTFAWPCIAHWVWPEPRIVVMSFALALGLHPLASLVGYLIGARKSAR
jgi:hypothetical protein